MTSIFRLLPLALGLAAASPAASQTDFAELNACLADPARTAAVFAERFPHEGCDPASTCDAKLVTSAKTIAARNCRQDAISSCTDANCLTSLTNRWTQTAQDLNDTLAQQIENLDLTALPRLTANRIARHGTAEPRRCPTAPEVLSAVIGQTAPASRACEIYLSLTTLEASEAMSRILAGIDAK